MLAWDGNAVSIQRGGPEILPSDLRAVAFDSQMRDLDRLRHLIPRFANGIHQDGPAGPVADGHMTTYLGTGQHRHFELRDKTVMTAHAE